MADPKSEPDAATERFRAALAASNPPTGGLPLEGLVAEVMPLLTLLTELTVGKRASDDFESFEFRECFTMLTLVGRRLALLDLTPTSALRITRLALRAVDPSEVDRVEGFAQHAVAAAVEGFVLGREERVTQIADERAAASLKPLRIDELSFALIISGVHEPTVLSECVDALGRAMLDADLELAIVDLSQLGEPNRERATAMFAADEVAKMLGGRCVFTGVDRRWRAAAADARVPLDAFQISSDLAEALAEARNLASRAAKKRNSSWRALLDRLRR